MARTEIRLMEAAIALAEELNFSRAGHRLGRSQPAVTKQIAELEKRLGFPLFERQHQLVILTDAGRAFVEEARLALFHSERAIQAAKGRLESGGGHPPHRQVTVYRSVPDRDSLVGALASVSKNEG